jgi:hypothetical protein
MLAFKIYISRTAVRQFKYYLPTPEEVEDERSYAVSEKRTRHSEMEKRFLHPALQADKLFTIMVHKSQEALARDVLSAYPWFASKSDGVPIKAVKEENLEYDPIRDNKSDWDAKSIASTDMLGGKSEIMSTAPGTPGTPGTPDYTPHPLPMDNPSTDYLLAGHQAMRQPGSMRFGAHHPAPSTDSIAGAPLLQFAQSSGYDDSVPYPPSAYTQPPIGYIPPTLRRTGSNMSAESDDNRVPRTRWDSEVDLGHQMGYSDPYRPYDPHSPPDLSQRDRRY